jgi:hypothetical protein
MLVQIVATDCHSDDVSRMYAFAVGCHNDKAAGSTDGNLILTTPKALRKMAQGC